MGVKKVFVVMAIGFMGTVHAFNIKDLIGDVVGSISKDKCRAISELKLPTEFGLDTCVGSNLLEVAKVALEVSSKCSVMDIYEIPKNKDLLAFGKLLHEVAFNTTDASSLIYNYMQGTSKESLNQVCQGLSTRVSPCFEAIIPKLLEIVEKDTKCCSSLKDALDMLTFVTPKDTSIASILLNDFLNGINQFVCGTHESGDTCGYVMCSQFTKKYTKKEFSVLDS